MSPLLKGLMATFDEEQQAHDWMECHKTLNTLILYSDDNFMKIQFESIKRNLPWED